MKRKTSEEKEKIIKEIEKVGIVEGCRKHNISASTYYTWDRQYKSHGIKGLRSYSKNDQKDLKRLEKENALLKELIISKELQIQMQADLIKKKMEQWKTRET